MKNILNYTLDRLSENSTWRGLLMLGTAVGLKTNPEMAEQIITVGLSAVGLINVLRKAPKSPKSIFDK